MLAKIRERTQGALLRKELLCGEANFRTLAEHRRGSLSQDGETIEDLFCTVDRELYGMKPVLERTHSASLNVCEFTGQAG